MSLEDYNRKRDFKKTPEPKGNKEDQQEIKRASSPHQDQDQNQEPLRFVVQLHEASRLHYDFRIEVDGVFKSWAVPKGPSLNPHEQHLAVQVEDHPLAYGDFEGIIPKGNYGAGTVMIWDEGTYIERHSKGRIDSEKALLKALKERHITLILEGKKLRGEFALIGLNRKEDQSWLLIKKRDEFASRQGIPNADLSVKTRRTLREIAHQAESKGEIWLPKRTEGINDPHSEPDDSLEKKTLAKPAPGQQTPPSKKPSKVREKIPRRNKPMLATPWPHPFEQEGWTFEIDRGGYRALAEIERHSVHLYSRQHLPFESKFPKIVEALRAANITAVLDGEIADGLFWVRDLLHLDGENTRNLPLLERKALLKNLPLYDLDSNIRYSVNESQCSNLFETAKNEGFPAILARDAYSTYQAGTSKQWLRIPTEIKTTAEEGPRLTHLNKLYWPDEKITKGDLIDYYRQITPILLPHLKDRPQSMHRHPDGIAAPGFFHKDLTEHYPRWVQTERIYSHSVDKSVNYLLCQNQSTLLYMINLGCIEINPWLSRVGSLDHPDMIVIDLDPDPSTKWTEIIEVARETHKILEHVKAPHYCKTSGATGLHIYIPTQAQFNYDSARHFAEEVCRVIHHLFPKTTSMDRNPAKRRGRIYLDCFQNAEGQTVVAPYSVRPRAGAPISTPLLWDEVTPSLNPLEFTIRTLPQRLEKMGDLWQPVLTERLNLDASLSSLGQEFPIGR